MFDKYNKNFSTIVVAESNDRHGWYGLIRADFPDMDRGYIWCGKALGWLPIGPQARLHAALFASVEAAEKAAEKAAVVPLQE